MSRLPIAVLLLALVSSAVPAHPPVTDFQTLPLRIDLAVSTTSPTLPSYGSWVAMTASTTYSHSSQNFGWVSGAPATISSYDANSFTTGEGGFLQSALVLPHFVTSGSGETDPFQLELAALARDGHVLSSTSVGNRRATFCTAVNPSFDYVLVRVLIGRAGQVTDTDPYTVHPFPTHGIQIHDGDDTSSTTPPTTLITRDAYPDMVSGTGFPAATTGVWSRTLLSRGNFELPPEQASSGLQFAEGSFNNVWFKAATKSGTDSSHRLVKFTIDVDQAGAAGDNPFVGAIEIYPYAEPPASFSTTEGIVENSSFAWPSTDDHEAFSLGIAELSGGRRTDAILYFDGIVDDNLHAAAHLWVAGWLNVGNTPLMAYDPVEWTSLEKAIDLFEDGNHVVPTSAPSWAQEYRFRAREYERALVHQRLRALTSVQMPSAGGDVTYTNPLPGKPLGVDSIAANLGIAEALWRDIGAQQLTAVVGNPYVQPNPLFFKACTYLGINYWQRFTKWDETAIDGTAQAWFIAKAGFEIWRGFDSGDWVTGASDAPFALHDTLAMAHYMALADVDSVSGPDYDENSVGGIVSNYAGETEADVYGTPDSNWWDPALVDAADIGSCSVSSAFPAWAGAGGRFLVALKAVNDWWLQVGSSNGQYGGGSSDDVEFLLQQAKTLLPLRGSWPELTSQVVSILDPILEANVAYGYFSSDPEHDPDAAADVEHTAEETGDSLWAAEQLDTNEAFYNEYALKSLGLMDAVGGGGDPWTEVLDSGDLSGAPQRHDYPLDETSTPSEIPLRRFVAFYFDAEGAVTGPSTSVDDDYNGDVPLNARAVQPAFLLADFNRNSAVREHLREWAEWWWVVAEDSGELTNSTNTMPKPRGVLPGVVNFDGTYLHYGLPHNSTTVGWWTGSDTYAFNKQTGYMDLIYGMFLERFLDPDSDDASTNVDEGLNYLDPIYQVAKLVAQAYDDEADIVDWNHVFGEGSPYATAQMLLHTPGILHELALALPYFPEFADSTKCGTLLDADSSTLNAEVIDLVKQAIADPLMNPDQAGAAAWVTHDVGQIDEPFTTSFNWISSFFPLLTEWVGWTDRIFVDKGDHGGDVFFQAATGGAAGGRPNLQFTWEPVTGGTAADAAPLVIVPIDLGEVEDGLTRFLVHNFEADGFADSKDYRNVVLHVWRRLQPGHYELRIESNAGGDDEIALGSYSGSVVTFNVTRFGGTGTFRLPYAVDDCGSAFVVELQRVGDLTSTENIAGFWDIAVGKKDFQVHYDGAHISFTTPVHNLGRLAPPHTTAGTIYVYYSLTGAAGPWTAAPIGVFGTNMLAPAGFLTLDGQDTMDPVVDNFSFASINYAPHSYNIWFAFLYQVLDSGSAVDIHPGNQLSAPVILAVPHS